MIDFGMMSTAGDEFGILPFEGHMKDAVNESNFNQSSKALQKAPMQGDVASYIAANQNTSQNRNPYFRSMSNFSHDIDPAVFEYGMTRNHASMHGRASSLSTSQQQQASLHSTAPSSAPSDHAQRTMKRIEKMRSKIKRLETELQKVTAENQTLENRRAAADEANQKLSKTLDDIENEILGWELSRVQMMELDQQLASMNQAMLNIRELLDRKDGDDDDDLMLNEPFTEITSRNFP